MSVARKEVRPTAGFLYGTISTEDVYPPAALEYIWYALLTYGILGQAWGVAIPTVGGLVMVLLAVICLATVGLQALWVFQPAMFAICTGISAIAIAFFFQTEESSENSIIFVGWLCNVIVAQTVSRRPGFLHRFAFVAFAIGLGVLPFLKGMAEGKLMRAAASGTGISNPNSLGMWFGFCTVYFLMWGVQTPSQKHRPVLWALGLGCLFMVALTISRGPLLGIMIACVVGLRSTLKRHFVPLLCLVFLMWGVYESGAFQETIDHYTERGTQESGRGKVWPLAAERALDSLWMGYGFDDIKTHTARTRSITPHNALLYIVLGAGIVPLICFLGYLTRAGIGAWCILKAGHVGDAALLPPLVTFAFIETMTLDTAFMSAWIVVVFAMAAGVTRVKTI